MNYILRRGRPRKSTSPIRICIRITEEDRAKIKEMCDSKGVSITDLFREWFDLESNAWKETERRRRERWLQNGLN